MANRLIELIRVIEEDHNLKRHCSFTSIEALAELSLIADQLEGKQRKPRTVVCIHIQCTQEDNPGQRAFIADWLRILLEMMNRDGTLIDNAFQGADEYRIANTAIAVTVEERDR